MRVKEVVEGITVHNNEAKFNYNNKDGVSTKIGKGNFNPFTKASKDLNGHTIYSVYYDPRDIANKVILSIKGKGPYKVTPEDYNLLLARTSKYICYHLLKGVDTIVTPSSTSPIILHLLKEIHSIMPHLIMLPNSFSKFTDLSKITVNYNHPTITPVIAKILETYLTKARSTGVFELKKISPSMRKFLNNFHEIIDEKILKHISGQHVCVLDDLLVTGTTIVQVVNLIDEYGASKVSGVTIFKK